MTMAVIKKNHILGEPNKRLLLAIRAITGTISVMTIYIAYRMMPIADASTIHFSSPVFVAVFGYFILKERLSIVQIVTGIVTMIGVGIISKPEFIFGSESEVVHEHRLEGTILAIAASVTGALAAICLRKLKTTPVAVIAIWHGVLILIAGIVFLIIINELVWPTGWLTWLLLLGNGVCCVGDQFFFTIAFQYENAGPISVVRTFNIALVFFWEILFFSVVVEWTSIVGACLVFSCIIIISVYKWKTENPTNYNNVINKILCRDNQVKYISDKPSIDTLSQTIQ